MYLPDDLYDIVKSQGLPASRLQQDAVRDHCQRLEQIAVAHAYAQEIFAELGPPTAEEFERAETAAREIADSLRAGKQPAATPPANSPAS